jgi:hypothetical protein
MGLDVVDVGAGHDPVDGAAIRWLESLAGRRTYARLAHGKERRRIGAERSCDAVQDIERNAVPAEFDIRDRGASHAAGSR